MNQTDLQQMFTVDTEEKKEVVDTMLINFWLEEVEKEDNHEIQSLSTRDKEEALQIIQDLADYDLKVYKYSITETESRMILQNDPTSPEDEIDAICWNPERGLTGRIIPKKEGK